jgi:hypothetical protein
MLDEEQQTQICGQCDSSMDTTNTDICDICTITFHKRCIQLQNNMRKCYSCVGIDEQSLQADTIISVNDENTIQNCVTEKNIQVSPATYPKRHYESNEQTSLKELHKSNDNNHNEELHIGNDNNHNEELHIGNVNNHNEELHIGNVSNQNEELHIGNDNNHNEE